MKAIASEFLCDVLELVCIFARPTLSSAIQGSRMWGGPAVSARNLSALERRGYIELEKGVPDRRDRVIRLTAKGRALALGGRNPEVCWSRPWDGTWRLVLFDLPESQRKLRDALRRQLHAAHFGYLQNSVWVSPDPYDVDALGFKGAKIDAERLLTLNAVPGTGEKNSDIVSGAWDFEEINRAYAEVIRVLERGPDAVAKKASGGTPPFRLWVNAVRDGWRKALAIDPLLPQCLWPQGYLGEKAWKLRKKKIGAASLALAKRPTD